MGNGQENLIPFNELTEDERRELARKAGEASGVARREKKTLRGLTLSNIAQSACSEIIHPPFNMERRPLSCIMRN